MRAIWPLVVVLLGWSSAAPAKDIDSGNAAEGQASGQAPEEVETPAEAAEAGEAEPATEAPAAEQGESKPGDWLPGKFSAMVALTSNYISRALASRTMTRQ